MLILIKYLLILIIITNVSTAEEIEKILFSVKNEIYTTIDLNNRINYLKVLSNNNDELTKENYLNDFISVLLYDEYAKENNININEKIINDYFNSILIKYKTTSSNIQINEDVLLNNIRYDYQRKTIIESLLNKKNILRKENKIFDIYNIKFDYFTFNSKIDKNLDQILKLIDFKNIDLTKKNLNKKLIDFVYLSNVINSLENINQSLQNEIFNNKKVFVLKENDYVLIGKITKEFKQNIDLKITFFKISSNIEIDSKIIVCHNIDNIKSEKNINITKFDNIEISKISGFIIKNLISINDKILVKDENSKYYLILCEFKYNSKTSKQIIINNKIDDEIINLENNFLFEQKIKYNFKWYE